MNQPILLFLIMSLIWLVVGTLLALIASLTLHTTNLFPNWECLTFGRIRSAHLNIMAFGWLNNAAFAISLWIMSRIAKYKIDNTALLFIAGLFWNIGIFIGCIGILQGDITSIEWLEMPAYATPLLTFSYFLIGIWGIIIFFYRKNQHVYVSQWYILAALFWFPWIYVIAQTMIIFFPARGTVQAIVNWWFAHNVLGLWYTPIALAAIYYFIPKVLGKPVKSYYLSVLGFWSLALFYNWAGVHHLIGGPIPVWLISIGIVASVFMIIPVIVTAINHYMTIAGSFYKAWNSPALRFIVFGTIMYTAVSFIGSTMALREVNEVVHFTHAIVGHAHHGVYAFVTMVMFGSFYYIMPRLLMCEWPSSFLIKIHFWFAVTGIILMVLVLHIGGWIQGKEMNNPDIPFLEVVKNTVPWLKVRSISGLLLAISHIAFFINIIWMIIKKIKKDYFTISFLNEVKIQDRNK